MAIPADIEKNLVDDLNFNKPSKIQKTAIPQILKINDKTGNHNNLIALAATGSGKTAAFGVGSVMRIDRALAKL